jgi:hypothetical protein
MPGRTPCQHIPRLTRKGIGQRFGIAKGHHARILGQKMVQHRPKERRLPGKGRKIARGSPRAAKKPSHLIGIRDEPGKGAKSQSFGGFLLHFLSFCGIGDAPDEDTAEKLRIGKVFLTKSKAKS